MSDSRFAGKVAIVTGGASGILNTSSGAATGSFPMGMTAYAASKAAVESITRTVAVQYGRQGIRCNAIAPGITPTEQLCELVSPEVYEVMRWAIQAPSLATVDQQAAVVAFLASDDASYLNGHTIPVDAGSAIATTTHILLRYGQGQGIVSGIGFGQPARPA